MKRVLASFALALCAFSAFALPTVENVQSAISSGDYAKAESMMLEVVTAKPGSAKAHYLYAEILAHNRHFDQAVEEAAQAQRIDPELKFTQPEKFRAFEDLLGREQTAAHRTTTRAGEDRSAVPAASSFAPAEHGSGVPGWMWGLGVAAVGLILWRALGARRPNYAGSPATGMPATTGPAYNNAYGPGPGYGPGYGQASAPMQGSGLLGTGVALAGGVAAGMLAEKLLDGRRESSGGLFGSPSANTPGFFEGPSGDNSAAQELEQRPIDLGSGGGDWGGDDGGSSGGNDGGGGDGGW